MTNSFNMQQIHTTLNQVETKLTKNAQLRKLKEQTKIPITYMLIGVLVIIIMIIYFLSGLCALTNLVAFVYPAYMTIKAIKGGNKSDDRLWLAYWLWYGLFALVESITDFLLFWIPFYEFLKMGFYVFLYAPNTQGALLLYSKFIEPLLPYLEAFEQQFEKSSTTKTKST